MTTADYTIICSTRNRPESLLQSLLRTRMVLPVEIPILVFDDASDDRNAVVSAIASVPNARILRSEIQVGPGVGRNCCLENSHTEFCLSLDDDCYLGEMPDLSRWLQNRDEDQDVAVIGFRYYNTKDQIFGPDHDVPGPSNTLLGGASLLRRKAVLRAGGYLDWLVFACEDSELGERLIKLGYRIWYDPTVIVYHDHVPVVRDERWESFYYIRNAYLVCILRHGLAGGFVRGILSAVRRGFFHTKAPSQTPRALVAAMTLSFFCRRERLRLFSIEHYFTPLNREPECIRSQSSP